MSPDDDRTFEAIDWDAYDPSGRVITRKLVALALSLVALGALFAYDYLVLPRAYALVGGYSPSQLDWLALFAAVLVLFFGIEPLATNRRLALHYWRRYRRNRLAVVAAGYLVVFAVLAIVGPELWGDPSIAPKGRSVAGRGPPPGLPPFWTEVDAEKLFYCATPVLDGMCQGTTVHPLGTTPDGQDVLALVFAGMRVALQVAVITAAIIVPIATTVGTVAAYYGGRVGGVLMRYVDLQQAIPAFILYLLAQYLYGPSLVAIVLLFGLFDWGRIARRVRGDALRHRDAGFVVAARDAGATPMDTVRRHMVPNVANTVFAGLAIQIPFIVIMEATFAYLGYVNSDVPSWGYALKVGLAINTAIPEAGFAGWAWWGYLFPLAALLVTIVAMSVAGDALHDAIEPRERGESQ